MYDGTVELFSYALEEGMGVGKASGPCELPKTSAFTSSLFRRKGRLCTISPGGLPQKTGGAGIASIPAPPVTCFYTICLTARPSGMAPRRRLPAAGTP